MAALGHHNCVLKLYVGFSLQNETLILDDLFYLCNVNAARLSYLYESSVGAREALKKTEKDINTCF